MTSAIKDTPEAARVTARRKDVSGGSGRQNRTLSLKVRAYQAFKKICRSQGLTVSEVVDDLIVSYVDLKQGAPSSAGKKK